MNTLNDLKDESTAVIAKVKRVVSVTFNSSSSTYPGRAAGKEYVYLTDDPSIEVGDVLVVESPYDGFVTVTTTKVDLPDRTGKATKWIVSKVDTEAYRLREERRRLQAEQLAAMAKLEQKLEGKAMEILRREKLAEIASKDASGELTRMLEELAGLKASLIEV